MPTDRYLSLSPLILGIWKQTNHIHMVHFGAGVDQHQSNRGLVAFDGVLQSRPTILEKRGAEEKEKE